MTRTGRSALDPAREPCPTGRSGLQNEAMPTAPTIRPAVPADYDAIVAVADEWWGRPIVAVLPPPVPGPFRGDQPDRGIRPRPGRFPRRLPFPDRHRGRLHPLRRRTPGPARRRYRPHSVPPVLRRRSGGRSPRRTRDHLTRQSGLGGIPHHSRVHRPRLGPGLPRPRPADDDLRTTAPAVTRRRATNPLRRQAFPARQSCARAIPRQVPPASSAAANRPHRPSARPAPAAPPTTYRKHTANIEWCRATRSAWAMARRR